MPHSIYVQEYGSEREVELCHVAGDPEPTIAGLRAKTLMVDGGGARRRTKIPKYTSVRSVELTR